ncbi:MAG: Hsp20/alpha crystallin family protein, partial [Candidatus Niyogibacteria bacterium]|nr:Hsp20/alpha crystallin family protein [Candidatus Niyogibacteria bacterium]
MPKDKRSIFERLSGSVSAGAAEEEEVIPETAVKNPIGALAEEAVEEGQLTVDVFQTPEAIIVQSTVAGVKPEDLDVSITQEMVTINGVRRAAFDA